MRGKGEENATASVWRCGPSADATVRRGRGEHGLGAEGGRRGWRKKVLRDAATPARVCPLNQPKPRGR